MAVANCPLCELKFPNRREVAQHLEFDHPGRIELPPEGPPPDKPERDV